MLLGVVVDMDIMVVEEWHHLWQRHHDMMIRNITRHVMLRGRHLIGLLLVVHRHHLLLLHLLLLWLRL
jgi:hypothetical protein